MAKQTLEDWWLVAKWRGVLKNNRLPAGFKWYIARKSLRKRKKNMAACFTINLLLTFVINTRPFLHKSHWIITNCSIYMTCTTQHKCLHLQLILLQCIYLNSCLDFLLNSSLCNSIYLIQNHLSHIQSVFASQNFQC